MRIVAVMAALACASVALAEKPRPTSRKYVMRELRFDGPITPAQRELLHDRVWSAVEVVVSMRGDELVHLEDRIAASIEHKGTKGCFEPRCHLELAGALSANRVLVVSVGRRGAEGEKGDWSARVESFDADTVHTAAARDIPCAGCTTEQLIGKINDAIEPLFAADKPVPSCTLAVSSAAGATVVLDGAAVGEVPFSHALAAGRHRVGVQKPGLAGKEVEIDCAAGTTPTVSLALDEAAPPPEPVRAAEAPRRLPLLKIAGGALVGVGAAVIIGGAVALAFDGKGTCDKAADQAECPMLYESTGVGAALVGAGAAALVGGAVLLIIDSVRTRPSSLALDLGPLPSGGFAALRGTF